MRSTVSLVSLAAMLVVRVSTASADTTTTTIPAPAAAPVQETIVRGTPPDLAGRWLALAWLDADGRVVTVPELWDIAVHDGKLELTQRFVTLPAPIHSALDEAVNTGQRWEPSAADLKRLDSEWEQLLPDEGAHVAKVQNEIAAADGFDDSLKGEARTKDAVWVMRQRQDMDGRTGVIRQVTIHAALSRAAGGWTGNADVATISAMPFPLPILLKGTSRLYRLNEEPGGWVSRILGIFAGCGRGAR